MTFNEDLFDAIVRHQVGLLQYSAHVRRRVWELLDASESEVKRKLRGLRRAGFDTPTRLQNLEGVLKRVRKVRLNSWADVRAELLTEMRKLSVAEPEFIDGIVGAAVPGVVLGTALPDPARLRDIVTHRPFQGKVLKEWADTLEADDIDRIERAIKIGLTQNETIPQISRRIVGSAQLKGSDGMTAISRREAAAIVRTAVNGIASEARQEYFSANSDLAPQKLFTATLDSRTTPICRSLDGNLYDVDDPKAPRLPLHFGERSAFSPILDGEVIGDRPRRDFTNRSLLRDYAKENGLDKAPLSRDQLPTGHKGAFDAFARSRMRELTGTTPAKTTYQQWLTRQSAANQDDILGPTRGALFRRGGLTLDKFVERDGSEITLAQLADKYASAFRRANLDPSQFN